jgi:Uma2 family endonuclease
MAMPVALRRFTVDDLRRFPDDGNRYELLDGVLFVTPGPELAHQIVAMRLAAILHGFLRDEPGVIVTSPGTVMVRPGHHLEPDVLVSRLPPGARVWEDVREHWLAVEIQSVSTRVYDEEYKQPAYLDLGVREVWLVDPDARRVRVFCTGGRETVARDRDLTWRSPGSSRPLLLDLGEVFAGLAAVG